MILKIRLCIDKGESISEQYASIVCIVVRWFNHNAHNAKPDKKLNFCL
jgi:hypothetical protein